MHEQLASVGLGGPLRVALAHDLVGLGLAHAVEHRVVLPLLLHLDQQVVAVGADLVLEATPRRRLVRRLGRLLRNQLLYDPQVLLRARVRVCVSVCEGIASAHTGDMVCVGTGAHS